MMHVYTVCVCVCARARVCVCARARVCVCVCERAGIGRRTSGTQESHAWHSATARAIVPWCLEVPKVL